MVLAGNKLDLEEIREVPVCEAYTAALRLSSAYVETSAQEFTNVQDVFSAAVVKIDVRPVFQAGTAAETCFVCPFSASFVPTIAGRNRGWSCELECR